MCGIVGAVSARNVVPVLIDGIRRLEYRGYDSTGLAVIDERRRRAAPRAARQHRARRRPRGAGRRARSSPARTGISHTRWATHGAPTPANAHPHMSDGEIAVVHNGIIENYEALRERLKAQGYVFATQTDTEVIAHLVHAHWHGAGGGDLLRAVQRGGRRIPRRLRDRRDLDARAGPRRRRARRAARWSSGIGDGRSLPRLRRGGAAVGHAPRRLPRGRRRRRRAPRVVRDLRRARRARRARGGHRRGVGRRGRARARTATSCRRRSSSSRARSPTRSKASAAIDARAVRRRTRTRSCAQVDSVLCSPAAPATTRPRREAVDRVARAAFPCQVEIASEYRYRDSVPNPNALVVVVSQSGETADTLAALKHAKALGHAHTLAICNVATSSMVRQTALTYLTRAGTEIGVASTKAFTTQLVALFLLALTLAKLRGRLTAERGGALAARPAPPAGGAAGGAGARAAGDRVGRAVREEAARAVPRPRPALSDRARRRAQAEGNLVHPRRGLSGRRAEARAARAGRRRDAGGRDRAERRAARKAQVQPAGSARARRRALRRRRSRQPPARRAKAST